MADSCSNLKRSRTELLASISKPTCSGKFASARKLRISTAGLRSSTMWKSFCFKSVTRLPCLSVTVKTTFTSLIPTLIRGTSAESVAGSSEVLFRGFGGAVCGGFPGVAADEDGESEVDCGDDWSEDCA